MPKLIPIYTWDKGVIKFNRNSTRLSKKPWFQGALLMLCVLIAMLLANLPFTADGYRRVLETSIQLHLFSADGSFNLLFPRDLTVEKFINDILMVVFFFTVGLEIKREITGGELSSLKKALLPVIAAFGGVIAPGIGTSSEALFQRAAQLPRIELVPPKNIICRNTIQGMQAGIIFGYVGQIDEIARRIKRELRESGVEEEVKVIATGGLARMIAKESATIDKIDHFLTLTGLRVLYERNQKGRPQNVRTDNNPTPLEVGHIVSDEPGIYRTGQWGIRTENLITVIPAKQTEATTTEDEWLTFETLTLCFYDTNLIDMSLMTDKEIAWINAYHERVYKETAPLLNPDEAKYLARKCAPIQR